MEPLRIRLRVPRLGADAAAAAPATAGAGECRSTLAPNSVFGAESLQLRAHRRPPSMIENTVTAPAAAMKAPARSGAERSLFSSSVPRGRANRLAEGENPGGPSCRAPANSVLPACPAAKASVGECSADPYAPHRYAPPAALQSDSTARLVRIDSESSPTAVETVIAISTPSAAPASAAAASIAQNHCQRPCHHNADHFPPIALITTSSTRNCQKCRGARPADYCPYADLARPFHHAGRVTVIITTPNHQKIEANHITTPRLPSASSTTPSTCQRQTIQSPCFVRRTHAARPQQRRAGRILLQQLRTARLNVQRGLVGALRVDFKQLSTGIYTKLSMG